MFRNHQVRSRGKTAEKPAQRKKGKTGPGPFSVHPPVPVQYVSSIIPENNGAVVFRPEKGAGFREV
jgi:hypothetical protein